MLRRCRPLLGTFVEISADDEQAIEAAFRAVASVHHLMTAHDPDSDVSRINRTAHLAPVKVDDWTAQVIERAMFWAERSKGAFDPVRAGDAALRRAMLPRHPDQPLPEASDWTSLELKGPAVRLAKPACVDLGGIAKGFAADRAIDALRSAGCPRGLVNAGGDLAGFGPTLWQIAIAEPATRTPVAEISLDNEALATSAGLQDGSSLGFDHLGGRGCWVSVSVVARTACDADALTKIVWDGSGERLLADAGARALGITHRGAVETIGEPADAFA